MTTLDHVERRGNLKDAEIQRSAFARWVEHPVTFAEVVLGHTLWDIPIRIMDAITRPHAKVAVRGCHGSSKTFTAAELVLWWLLHDKRAQCITTAPTWNQVESQIWMEIRKALQEGGADRLPPLKFASVNQTSITITNDNFAKGLSTNSPDRFQGYHGKVLIIVDEATGVDAALWDAIDGIEAAGDVRILALGNPTVASGPFYEAFSKNAVGWTRFKIDALNTENTKPLGDNPEERLWTLLHMPQTEVMHNPNPHIVSRQWIIEKYHKWGPDNPRWESRARGNFPSQDPSAVFALSVLERAQHRPGHGDDGHSELHVGIDVAAGGDDETVVAVRCGPDLFILQAYDDADPFPKVLALLRPYRQRIANCNVDVDGLGFQFARRLEEADFIVTDIRAQSTPNDPERFRNAKSELYWNMRELLEKNVPNGITDDVAIGQFAAPLWSTVGKGQIMIEPKEKMAKRGVKSPDRAEAIIYCYADMDAQIAVPVIPSNATRRLSPPVYDGWQMRDSGIAVPTVGGQRMFPIRR